MSPNTTGGAADASFDNAAHNTPGGTGTGSSKQTHGGHPVIDAAASCGVSTLFTLSGAHVFPIYDAAVTRAEPMRIVDVRHEQTAVFAAEASAKLLRSPGLAVLTAGPGVTNGISAVTSAWFNRSPVVIIGGRAPAARWGSGALQEIDHPPLLAPVTKSAFTIDRPERIGQDLRRAFDLARTPRRGPVFCDVPMDVLFEEVDHQQDATTQSSDVRQNGHDPGVVAEIVSRLRGSRRPVLVLGTDVWSDRAEHDARDFARASGIPVIANGMGRGILPPDDPLLVTRARSTALGTADCVIVAGTPLDFRLGYGKFGSPSGAAKVIHMESGPVGSVANATTLEVSGSLDLIFADLTRKEVDWQDSGAVRAWAQELRTRADVAVARDQAALTSEQDPIHPARIYGELLQRLANDAVVAGDGGDFVSFAGRYLEPGRPGGWLDPGPYGCLGTGLGYAVGARLARPSSQVVLLLGDGAAGFSLMDIDTLVRHQLPVVIVVGNNGGWGLERHPMRFLYGYDVAAQLRQATEYDGVCRALGGAGETVTRAADIGPALDRAFESGTPYLINVHTDPEVAYPRMTTGV